MDFIAARKLTDEEVSSLNYKFNNEFDDVIDKYGALEWSDSTSEDKMLLQNIVREVIVYTNVLDPTKLKEDYPDLIISGDVMVSETHMHGDGKIIVEINDKVKRDIIVFEGSWSEFINRYYLSETLHMYGQRKLGTALENEIISGYQLMNAISKYNAMLYPEKGELLFIRIID